MKVNYEIDENNKQITMTPSQEGYEIQWKGFNTIKPMFDYVMILKDEERKTTMGGIVIPDTIKEKPSTGTVIAVGDGAIHPQTGVVTEMRIKVGDRVLFPKLVGQTIKIDGVEKTLLKQTEILGIIE